MNLKPCPWSNPGVSKLYTVSKHSGRSEQKRGSKAGSQSQALGYHDVFAKHEVGVQARPPHGG